MTELLLLLLIMTLIIFGLIEFILHTRRLKSIPIRIHINGTRGKSSVTRLIAAGLREGGIRTYAKTTGSQPRMITHDGSEYPIFRHSRANIIEQLRIVAFAAANKAQALVIECMALQPYLQHLSESKMVRATHGVITNAREDHLDIMGPGEHDVAAALLGTTPVSAQLFTCEKDYNPLFNLSAKMKNTEITFVTDTEISQVSDSELDRFNYIEFKENIALALKVCQNVGIKREIALRGMFKCEPDIGAMENCVIHFFGRKLYFVNGFAANDPESSETVWRQSIENHSDTETRIMVINTRIDRPDRSRQLGYSIHTWPRADKYILIGDGTFFFVKYAIKQGVNPRHFINCEDLPVETIFEEILNHCKKRSLICGIGNIAGPGLDLVQYFTNRSDI